MLSASLSVSLSLYLSVCPPSRLSACPSICLSEEVPKYTQAYACSVIIGFMLAINKVIVQELCESRGGHPGLSVLTSLPVSVDVKIY